ncbi:hypothetical protein N7468_003444 [Penicillium chermesinum]|uniref:Uncharacterized protein n=1 Tax=Penicillium chermesinum TaxID=63820 RepID=A0A9W9TRM0_9EURO|nr:uncharacterized protein N7468_003444 [Penicillium chermesinum]KAJ5238825.1 hypothetical protein N7468_003444 [Penicillium chermesinum]
MTSGFPMSRWLMVLIYLTYYPFMGVSYMVSGPSMLYKKHKAKKAIRPLPRGRKRALTLPLPKSSSHWHWKGVCMRQRSFDQLQSPFFRLPPNLRQLIYRQIIVPSDGADLHVGITSYRLCGIPCSEPDSPRGWQHNCWEPTDRGGRSVDQGDPSDSSSRGFFGLLQSCRRM